MISEVPRKEREAGLSGNMFLVGVLSRYPNIRPVIRRVIPPRIRSDALGSNKKYCAM
jgi:hypothetical protein